LYGTSRSVVSRVCVIVSQRFGGIYACVFRVSKFTHNPKDEGSTFLQNFWNKFCNHTVQKPRWLASSTLMWWKLWITVLISLRIYIYETSFVVCYVGLFMCMCLYVIFVLLVL
jgi:hypothetical protein